MSWRFPELDQCLSVRIKCRAQGYSRVPSLEFEPGTSRSEVQHSTTLSSSIYINLYFDIIGPDILSHSTDDLKLTDKSIK